MKMQSAMAESVAQQLEDDPNVQATSVKSGRHNEMMVVATVFNKHCERRVKRTLSEYPVYVELEVAGDAAN